VANAAAYLDSNGDTDRAANPKANAAAYLDSNGDADRSADRYTHP